MTRNLIILAFMFLAGATQAAEPFFVDCADALKSAPFRNLAQFYESHAEQPKPFACFRLNDQEFLAAVDDTGRIAQGLYHFDAKSGTYDLEGGGSRPNISIKREFDIGKKHFALMYASNLHAGQWDTWYEALYLQPRSAGQPYKIQRLMEIQQDPESGMCGSRIKSGVAADVRDLAVPESSPEAVISFELRAQSCPNGEFETKTRRFRWDGGQFVEEKAP